jgi:hypothetical protein
MDSTGCFDSNGTMSNEGNVDRGEDDVSLQKGIRCKKNNPGAKKQ